MDERAQLEALRRVLELFEQGAIESWLFGGWAVDFHVGSITRAHADLDLAVWASDLPRIAALLADDGWSHAPEPGEDGYTGYEHDGVRLELALLAHRPDGAIATPLRDGFAAWPADAFGDEVGELSGIRARVIGRNALHAEKSTIQDDARVAAKDRADVAALDRAES
jgi:hypothetical protein